MQYFRLGKIAVLMVSAVLLLSSTALPIARAAVYNCNGSGCGFWYDDSVWNNRYPGNTIYVDLNIYNTWAGSTTDTITTVQLTTPWGTYADNTLPQSVCYGCEYFYEADVQIPSTASPGDYSMTFTFSGTYSSGQAMTCTGQTNGCTVTISITVTANPSPLQAQVTSIQQTIITLNANITSLKAQVTTLQAQAASLQAQAASLQTQLTTAKGNITSLQNSLATTNAQLTTAQSNLASAQASLSTAQSQLASTQSTLSTYSNLYLPGAAAVPSAAAGVLLVLFLRKKP